MTITVTGADRYEDMFDTFFTALSEAAESTKIAQEAGKEKVYQVNLADLRALAYRLGRVLETID